MLCFGRLLKLIFTAMSNTPPRSISAFISADSDHSSLDSHDGASEDSYLEEATVVEATSVKTAATAGTAKTWGLDDALRKQLLEDIIDRGGLKQVDIARLIEDKPSYYANSAAQPKLTQQTKNVVQYWKREPDAYKKWLIQFHLEDKALGFGSTTPPKQKKAPASVKKTRASTKSSSKKSSAKKPTAKRSTVQESPSRISSPPLSSPPQVARLLSQQQPSTTMANPHGNDFTAGLRALAVNSDNCRLADTAFPERNGGQVTILTVTDVECGGYLRTCYVLALEADYRYVFVSFHFFFLSFFSNKVYLLIFQLRHRSAA